jgi:hypothetical protein
MAKKDREATEQEDIESHIKKLKQRAEELSGGQMFSETTSECSSEIEEQFWKNVVGFEEATWRQPYEVLIESGISLPSPEELDDPRLTAKLWEVINALALLRVYLQSTNHLSDRELYAHLWSESLREEMVLHPEDANYACYLDVIGSGSEEDIEIYLKYYADDEERQRWATEWNEALPARERQPFDRDRHLPQSRQGEEFGVQ